MATKTNTTPRSNDSEDALVAEARPDGTVIDHRPGRKSLMAVALEKKAPKVTAAPKPRNNRPAVAPRKEFNPRSHEICYEVLPTFPVEALSGREYVRLRVMEELAGPIGIWVLISAIGRGGNKEAAVYYATCQMAEEMAQNDTIRILFRWALTFGVYPIAPLEDGDFERWSNIAYRMERWATERKHPELANFRQVLKLNRIKPTEPNTPVVEVALPYEQVQHIAHDMGIEPIPVQERVSTKPQSFRRPVRKDAVAPKPVAVEPVPVVTPAPVAVVTAELEPDDPTEEVQANEPAVTITPEAPEAEEEDVAPPAPQPEPSPVTTQVVDEETAEAAKLAGIPAEEFLLKGTSFKKHYRGLVKRGKMNTAK